MSDLLLRFRVIAASFDCGNRPTHAIASGRLIPRDCQDRFAPATGSTELNAPTLTCRRLRRGRLEAHVVVGDLRLRVTAKQAHVVQLLEQVEEMTGEKLPVPTWLSPHFVKPMAGQTSFLDQSEESQCLPDSA